eukprot:scaffold1799_cov191-Amphora_coffeaeformis.AAC.3
MPLSRVDDQSTEFPLTIIIKHYPYELFAIVYSYRGSTFQLPGMVPVPYHTIPYHTLLYLPKQTIEANYENVWKMQ